MVSWWMMSRRESACSHGGGTMLARRCFLSKSANQRGILLLRGGRSWGVGPCKNSHEKKNIYIKKDGQRRGRGRKARLFRVSIWLQTRYGSLSSALFFQHHAAQGSTYRQEVDALQLLSRNDCDELHFAEKRDLGGNQSSGKRQGHGQSLSPAGLVLLVRVSVACVGSRQSVVLAIGQQDSRTAGQPDSRTAGQPDTGKKNVWCF